MEMFSSVGFQIFLEASFCLRFRDVISGLLALALDYWPWPWIIGPGPGLLALTLDY